MKCFRLQVAAVFAAFAPVALSSAAAQPPRLVEARFDKDPPWEGFRNRLVPTPPSVTTQDFGYRTTHHAGGRSGEIGGIVARSATPAWYAKLIPDRTLEDRLTASGRFAVTKADGGSGVMIGWFHETSRGWRTPNSLAMRLDGNGGKYWVFCEHGTAHGLTAGVGAFEGEQWQTTPTPPFAADGTPHRWQLTYEPGKRDKTGRVSFRIDERTYQFVVPAENRADGAKFNRFGIWNVQTPGDELEIYVDDLTIGDRKESFDVDPKWEAQGNHVSFTDRVRRPYHDFGFSQSAHAGGTAGEIGGFVFRDERPAYYATPVGQLSFDDELRASGKLVLVKAAADSAVYIGWLNAASKQANETPEHKRPQQNYLGIVLEGPSRVGHLFRPSYGAADARGMTASIDDTWTVIRPDGRVHDWSLHYDPAGARGNGRIELTVDGRTGGIDMQPGHMRSGATLDRFGIFNMQSGGHYVEVYFDDLKFTSR